MLATILSPLFASDDDKGPPPESDFWYGALGMTAASGVKVSVGEALRVPAIRRCVAVLSGAVASLPLPVLERTDRGDIKATRHPLYDVIGRRPNEWQSAYSFWETTAANLVLYNRAFAAIEPGPRGAIDRLEPIRADRVQVFLLDNGRLAFDFHWPGGRVERRAQEQVFYIGGMSLGKFDGPSIIEHGRDTIGLAIAINRMVGRQFRNGVRLSGVLQHPRKMGGDAAKFRMAWESMFSGGENAGKTAILEDGMTFKELSQTNDEAQLIQLWNHTIGELGRLFSVPNILLESSDKASTFASAEAFFQWFINISLMPWLRNIEGAVNSQLVLVPDRYKAEFSIQGLLRGNATARADFYAKGINAGWLARNEARQLENLPTREGADELLTPLNMSTSPDSTSSDSKGSADV